MIKEQDYNLKSHDTYEEKNDIFRFRSYSKNKIYLLSITTVQLVKHLFRIYKKI
jgi:hypothetical protein